MEPSPQSAGSEAPEEFAREARDAGLVLPTPKRLNPVKAVAVTAVILLAAVGIGYGSGWLNPVTSHAVGYTHPASCSTPLATLGGALAPSSSAGENATFANLTDNYTRSNGGCIAFDLVPASGSTASALAQPGIDFVVAGATIPSNETAALPHPVFEIPVLLGAVAVVYNLPAASGLQLDAAALAGIYLGTITSWSAGPIAALNPGAELAGAPPITPVYQPGSNGASVAFASFLSAGSAAWQGSVGSTVVAWPAGVEASGDAAVLSEVASTPGAIGFVSSNAVPPSSQVAAVENAAGDFTAPSSANVAAAAASAAGSLAGFEGYAPNLSLPSASGNSSYPIDDFGYFVVYATFGAKTSGNVSNYDAWWLLTFVEWIINSDAALGTSGFVATLPADLVNWDGVTLSEVDYDGTSVLVGPPDGTDVNETGETGVF